MFDRQLTTGHAAAEPLPGDCALMYVRIVAAGHSHECQKLRDTSSSVTMRQTQSTAFWRGHLAVVQKGKQAILLYKQQEWHATDWLQYTSSISCAYSTHSGCA